MKTKEQLEALFPKLLPGRVENTPLGICWIIEDLNYPVEGFKLVQDNQLLSLCREVEDTFTFEEQQSYTNKLSLIIERDWNKQKIRVPNLNYIDLGRTKLWLFSHTSWEQRIEAAAEMKLPKTLPICGNEENGQGL